MTLPRRKFLHLAVGAATLPTVTRIARAQNYPTRPVTMVVTYPAGSGSDVFARIIGPSLSEFLGQQVIIENVGGAGGTTGVIRVARAAPDGYQFVLGGTDTFAQSQTLYKNPPYRATTDFAPVALIVEQPLVLVTRNDLPANNLLEFIAYVRANQSTMQFGSAGAASASHLTCTYLNSAIGVNVTAIPYRGAPQGLQDLMAGRIDYYCAVVSAAIAHIENKTMKAIAILSRDRLPILPTSASAHEQGLVDFEVNVWNGIFLRARHSLAVRSEHLATFPDADPREEGTAAAPDGAAHRLQHGYGADRQRPVHQMPRLSLATFGLGAANLIYDCFFYWDRARVLTGNREGNSRRITFCCNRAAF
jgi:tripartite-type tricarboxylate transporter receptor subunit TctC